MTSADAWGIAAVFVLAGAAKGVTGMGLPTVAVSLLGLWLAPAQAAGLLVLPSLLTNVAQCSGPHWGRLVRLLWPAWLGLVLATLLAPAWQPGGGPVEPRTLLGAVLVAYGAWGLWRPALPDLAPCAHRVGAAVGLATGLMTALTAVFVMPLVPFLQALRLDKDGMVQALGLSFTVGTLALGLRLQHAGELVLLSLPVVLAVAAAFAGLALGRRLRERLSGPAFQRALFVAFIALGAANTWRP